MEKKSIIESIRDHYYVKKLYKEFDGALAEHAKLTSGAAKAEEIKNSEAAVKTSFVNLAKSQFQNLSYLSPDKVFDRIAFFAKHEKEFEKLTPPEAKDYPEDRISAKDAEDMSKTYNFSHAYEGTIYRELTPEERKGYRATLMGTGQIAGYVSDKEFQKVASSIVDMKKQSLNANTAEKQILNQALRNQGR